MGADVRSQMLRRLSPMAFVFGALVGVAQASSAGSTGTAKVAELGKEGESILKVLKVVYIITLLLFTPSSPHGHNS